MRSELLFLVLSAAPLHGQTTLAWRFQPGDAFQIERTFEQKQTVEVQQRTFEQATTSVWLTTFTVQKVDGEAAAVDMIFDRVTTKSNAKAMGDGPSDSQLAERFQGGKLILKITPAGRIQQLDGYGDLLKRLSHNQPEAEKSLRFIVPETGLKDGIEEIFGFVPEKPVHPGDRWQREGIEPVVPFGNLKTVFRYRYDGKRDDGHAIAMTLDTTYVPPPKDFELFQVIAGKVASEKGTGMFVFDVDKGRGVRGEKTFQVHGALTLETAGKRNEVKFTSANRVAWRTIAK